MFYWGMLIGVIIGANAAFVFFAMLFLAKMKDRTMPSAEDSYEKSLAHEQLLLDKASYLTLTATTISHNPR